MKSLLNVLNNTLTNVNAALEAKLMEQTAITKEGFNYTAKKLNKMDKKMDAMSAQISKLEEMLAGINTQGVQAKGAVQQPTVKNENPHQARKQYNDEANNMEPKYVNNRGIAVFGKCDCCGKEIISSKVVGYCNTYEQVPGVYCYQCQLKLGYDARTLGVDANPTAGNKVAEPKSTDTVAIVKECGCCKGAIKYASKDAMEEAAKRAVAAGLPQYVHGKCAKQILADREAFMVKFNKAVAKSKDVKAEFTNIDTLIGQYGYLTVEEAVALGDSKEFGVANYRTTYKALQNAINEVFVKTVKANGSVQGLGNRVVADKLISLVDTFVAKKHPNALRAEAGVMLTVPQAEEVQVPVEVKEEVKAPKVEEFAFDNISYALEDVKEACTALGFAFRKNMAKSKREACLEWLKENKKATTYVTDENVVVTGSYADVCVHDKTRVLTDEEMEALKEKVSKMKDVSDEVVEEEMVTIQIEGACDEAGAQAPAATGVAEFTSSNKQEWTTFDSEGNMSNGSPQGQKAVGFTQPF